LGARRSATREPDDLLLPPLVDGAEGSSGSVAGALFASGAVSVGAVPVAEGSDAIGAGGSAACGGALVVGAACAMVGAASGFEPDRETANTVNDTASNAAAPRISLLRIGARTGGAAAAQSRAPKLASMSPPSHTQAGTAATRVNARGAVGASWSAEGTATSTATNCLSAGCGHPLNE